MCKKERIKKLKEALAWYQSQEGQDTIAGLLEDMRRTAEFNDFRRGLFSNKDYLHRRLN